MHARIESPLLQPGQRWEALAHCPEGLRVSRLDRDPPSAACFELERVRALTAGEVLAYTNGRETRPGLHLRIKNKGGSPAIFRALALIDQDPEALETSVGLLAEEAWRRGGDPVTSDDQLRELLRRSAVVVYTP
jgi:hypothetical protein